MVAMNRNKMVDLSHHLNSEARAKRPSMLKELLKYSGQEGMLIFGAGKLPLQKL